MLSSTKTHVVFGRQNVLENDYVKQCSFDRHTGNNIMYFYKNCCI